MTSVPFGTQLIGRTEKALNAILDRLLAGTGLTEPQWVALTLTVAGGDDAAGRIAHALRVDRAAARDRIAELEAADLVRTTAAGTPEPTDRGAALWREVRAAAGRVTQELWGDLPDADLAVAGRVLNTVLTRADTVLTAPAGP